MNDFELIVPDLYTTRKPRIKINMASGRSNPKPAPPSNPIVQFFGQFKGAFQKSPKITIDKKTMENVWKLMDKVREWLYFCVEVLSLVGFDSSVNLILPCHMLVEVLRHFKYKAVVISGYFCRLKF